jgi:hypothetical protein
MSSSLMSNANGSGRKVLKHSEETCAKISVAKLGKLALLLYVRRIRTRKGSFGWRENFIGN